MSKDLATEQMLNTRGIFFDEDLYFEMMYMSEVEESCSIHRILEEDLEAHLACVDAHS